MHDRRWTLTLIVPDEPTRIRHLSRDELAETLRARMTGELALPEAAELSVSSDVGDVGFRHELPLAA